MNKDSAQPTIPQETAGSFQLPALGLGTWQMGGGHQRNRNNDDQRDITAIQTAIRLGLTHIDTAEAYADGYAETLVGKAIEPFDRKTLFITTKVRRSNLKYDAVIQAAKTSIKRLGINQIDLYLIHGYNNEIPLEESIRGLDFLLENELTRFIGVSNFDVPLLQRAQAATRYKIMTNQIHYNLAARAYEKNGTIDYCQKNGVLVTAYRMIGYDQFSPTGLVLLETLAKKYHKTIQQIAINWVINQPNVVGLVKSTNPVHLKEAVEAISWQLDAADQKTLSDEFPSGLTINTP
jgi:diketogulonate reductase-like aldo/keto reductase